MNIKADSFSPNMAPVDEYFLRTWSGNFVDADVQRDFIENHLEANLAMGYKSLVAISSITWVFRIWMCLEGFNDTSYWYSFVYTSLAGGALIIITFIAMVVVMRTTSKPVLHTATYALALLVTSAGVLIAVTLLFLDAPMYTDQAMFTNIDIVWSGCTDAPFHSQIEVFLGTTLKQSKSMLALFSILALQIVAMLGTHFRTAFITQTCLCVVHIMGQALAPYDNYYSIYGYMLCSLFGCGIMTWWYDDHARSLWAQTQAIGLLAKINAQERESRILSEALFKEVQHANEVHSIALHTRSSLDGPRRCWKRRPKLGQLHSGRL